MSSGWAARCPDGGVVSRRPTSIQAHPGAHARLRSVALATRLEGGGCRCAARAALALRDARTQKGRTRSSEAVNFSLNERDFVWQQERGMILST